MRLTSSTGTSRGCPMTGPRTDGSILSGSRQAQKPRRASGLDRSIVAVDLLDVAATAPLALHHAVAAVVIRVVARVVAVTSIRGIGHRRDVAWCGPTGRPEARVILVGAFVIAVVAIVASVVIVPIAAGEGGSGKQHDCSRRSKKEPHGTHPPHKRRWTLMRRAMVRPVKPSGRG